MEDEPGCSSSAICSFAIRSLLNSKYLAVHHISCFTVNILLHKPLLHRDMLNARDCIVQVYEEDDEMGYSSRMHDSPLPRQNTAKLEKLTGLILPTAVHLR